MYTPAMKKQTAFEKAVAHCGSKRQLALGLGIKPQSITDWNGQVPVTRVLAVEKLTGISRHEIRPDIYGAAP
tara:strand:+ start:21902 stop:22117 length:216 start_codon:yes stop_codon:yes gene_type:complete